MECSSKKQQSGTVGLVKSLNDCSLFGGKWTRENVDLFKNEIKEKEKNFLKVQRDRKLELKRQEELRKEEEIAYRKFCRNEARIQKGIENNVKPLYTPPPMSFGRGALLSGLERDIRGEKVRGRGRLSPEEKECLPLYDRIREVKWNLDQFTDSSLHNNKVQESYWLSLQHKEEEEEEEEDCNNVQEYINCRTPTSSSTPDQFEDAFDSPQSDSPRSFRSAPSQASNSPATTPWPCLVPVASNDPPLQPQPRIEASSSTTPRKRRGSRLAAKFSNNFEEDHVNGETPYNINNEEKPLAAKFSNNFEEDYLNGETPYNINNEEKPQTSDRVDDDPLAVLGLSQPPLAPSRFRKGPRSTGGGMLFKHINPSHRVSSNTVLAKKDLFYCNIANSNPSTEFNLNEKDFPAL